MVGRKIILVCLAVLILSSGAAVFAGMMVGSASESGGHSLSKNGGYIAHDPIYINGNSDFTEANGVVSGSGTEGDPYIISGWSINASTGTNAGIDIRNTDKYFIIKDCKVYDGKITNKQGIIFSNVKYGKIENVIVENNYRGIYFSTSSESNVSIGTKITNSSSDAVYIANSMNNTLLGINASSNAGYGVTLYKSENNAILNSFFGWNTGYGVYLTESKNNNIKNTNISYTTGTGIRLASYSNNTFMKNVTAYKNTNIGINLDGSSYNNISDSFVINNTGTGIDYGGATVENDIYNTEVKDNDGTGIDLQGSSYVDIVGCNISQNKNKGGIYSSSVVTNINITNTEVWNNLAGNGIDFYGTEFVNVTNSKFIANAGNGISFNGSSIQEENKNNIIKNCVIAESNNNGVYFYAYTHTYDGSTIYIQNNNIYSNTIYSNEQNGIYFYGCGYDWAVPIRNNNIYSNTVYLNGQNGIYFYAYTVYQAAWVDNNNIYSNTVYSNGQNGIYFYAHAYPPAYIDNNNIYSNTVYSNGQNGIYFYGYAGYNVYIQNNNIYSNIIYQHNSGAGIYFQADNPSATWQESNLYNNTITSNLVGIKFLKIKSHNVYDNTISSCENDAILFENSASNTVKNNNISASNWSGIKLNDLSYSNTIENNDISGSNIAGIFITGISNSSTVHKNDIHDNTGVGINITNAYSSQLDHNNIRNNAQNAYDDTNAENQWDDGAEGNYWTDYTGFDLDENGIGDVPYDVPGGGSRDYYPLMAEIDVTSPSSNVNTISPYWQTSMPFIITATVSGDSGDVANVSLYYRYSNDNTTWGSWTLFSTDTATPWEWSFDAPNGNGYYQFYSIATDNAGNIESVPAIYDAECKCGIILPHNPIYINGNSQFTSANGVVSGSGTESNPYIIENWDINTSTESGIEVRNTDVYFIIRNCVIHGDCTWAGIYFYNVTNSKIDNVTSYNNFYSIHLYSSSNNIINTCNLYNNYDNGTIYLSSSSNNNQITNCSIYNNSVGILLQSSSNNTIANCAVYNNNDGIGLSSSSNNNQITNCAVYNNYYYGIYLYSSSNNNITNSAVYNNYCGIYLIYPSNNQVHYCNIYNNTYYGVYNYNTESEYSVNATNNWWGSASGPGAGGANGVHGAVIYSPWLTEPWGGGAVNQPPTAYIDSISPNPATQGQTVSFVGHGTDTDGTVVAYNWRSSIDGQLSTSTSFSTSSLSVGTHTIYFKVQDNNGTWSSEVSVSLIINQSGGLTPHAPIYINGNSQFTSENGVTGGSGTAADPYIIENWDINASSANGIYIENTDVYFIIRNCVIYDGKSNNHHGIYFCNMTSGKLDNVTSRKNFYGIYLDSSSNNNTITNCDVYNNGCGILLASSPNNQITNCAAYNNSGNNSGGIFMYSSSNNKLRNNILENNKYNFGVGGWDISHYYQDIDTSNTINGKPIYYVMSQNNLLFDSSTSVGYLGLVSCTSIRVENLTFANNIQGLLLVNTSYSTIINCTVYNNGDGIYLYSSSNNTISANHIYNNSYGIKLWDSSNTEIHYNNIYNNTGYGVYNYNSASQYSANATYNWWGSASGPYHPTTNPSGTGDNVSDNVLYEPWLTEPWGGEENNPPVLSNGSVSPLSGDLDTVFEFNVTYTDEDDNAPVYVNVTIDNINYSMEKHDDSDNDYTDGCIYEYSTSLSEGFHSYSFEASDGINATSTWTTYGIKVTENNPPAVTLSSPSDGETITFTFVTLTWTGSDPDNDTLTYDIYLDSTDGSTLVSDDQTEIYYYTASDLLRGVTYYWKVIPNDGKVDGTCTSGVWSFTVSEEAVENHAPVVNSITASPTTVETGSTVTITVDATDEDTGDILTYHYSCSDGTISGSGSSVTWTAPDTTGNYTITVHVNDGEIDSNSKSIAVMVTAVITETFEDPDTGTTATVQYTGTGTITITSASSPGASPSGVHGINVFVEVTVPETMTVEWVYIVVPYSESDLPAGVDESKLRLFYWTDTGWEKCEDTGVDTVNNVVWANISHLTIFAPMAEKAAAGEEGVEGGIGIGGYWWAAVLVAVIIVVVGMGVGYVKRRKVKMGRVVSEKPTPPPVAPPKPSRAEAAAKMQAAELENRLNILRGEIRRLLGYNVGDLKDEATKILEMIKNGYWVQAGDALNVLERKVVDRRTEKDRYDQFMVRVNELVKERADFFVDDIKAHLSKGDFDKAEQLLGERRRDYEQYLELVRNVKDVEEEVTMLSRRLAKSELTSDAYERARDDLDKRKYDIDEKLWKIQRKIFREKYEKPF